MLKRLYRTSRSPVNRPRYVAIGDVIYLRRSIDTFAAYRPIVAPTPPEVA